MLSIAATCELSFMQLYQNSPSLKLLGLALPLTPMTPSLITFFMLFLETRLNSGKLLHYTLTGKTI